MVKTHPLRRVLPPIPKVSTAPPHGVSCGAVKRLLLVSVLGALLLAGRVPAHASSPTSDWPSLNADAAQSNDNPTETTLTAQNVLKLRVKWTASISQQSYPVVVNQRVYVPFLARNKIHVRVLDARTGKPLLTIPKDALGGMVETGGELYLAGHVLQAVDAATGEKMLQINAHPQVKGGEFLNPVADGKVVVSGYVTNSRTVPSQLYAVDASGQRVAWKSPSVDATGAIAASRIATQTTNGAVFYDESTGKTLAHQSNLRSQWFAGSKLLYTVATPFHAKKPVATLYAFTAAGHQAWKRVIGPDMIASDWPHAVDGSALYVATLKPRQAVEALDPSTGVPLWTRPLANVQRLAVANNLLFAVTYGLGQPARIVVLHTDTGAPVGAIVLSPGYFAFTAANGLMVADGMVFLRVVGPPGSELLGLALPQ